MCIYGFFNSISSVFRISLPRCRFFFFFHLMACSNNETVNLSCICIPKGAHIILFKFHNLMCFLRIRPSWGKKKMHHVNRNILLVAEYLNFVSSGRREAVQQAASRQDKEAGAAGHVTWRQTNTPAGDIWQPDASQHAQDNFTRRLFLHVQYATLAKHFERNYKSGRNSITPVENAIYIIRMKVY